MFDDPGKKLKALEQELREADPEAMEPVEFAEEDYPDEFDESRAVIARQPKRAGLKTLVLLLLVAGALAGARWLGWI
ncbi:MAG: hypothetical protein Q4F17_11620 [Eubacteriales bacterium]|nr:hypothetical protein [Eubacteriales bacterium]